ncbi:response regulator [Spirochaeta lutea]|uniref:AraC family transcriptional regulator n=1 Tax=Spirochaeta lutea TaxID=1480694 RepID=A0A098QU62_9SPIO|nr:response regulator [Spirochaeta lutea]KGE70923.1 hypothetical protein DC28_13345 [Spirochaeta lutea]
MYSVMIVDDEELVLRSFAYTIQNHAPAFRVCAQASSGLDALELAKDNNPDIVILDIAMPGLDGLETLEQLREVNPDLQCILSTAYERFDLAQRAIPLGVFRYLVKPVGKKTLLEALEGAGQQIESRRKLSQEHRQDAQRLTHSHRLEEEHFMQELLCGTLDGESWNLYRRSLWISADRGFILVLSARGGSSDASPGGFTDLRRVYREFVDWVNHRVQCFALDIGRLVLFIVTRRESSFFQGDLTARAEDLGLVDLRMGWGSTQPYDTLDESYKEALAMITRSPGNRQSHRRQERDRILAIQHSLKRCEELGTGVFLENLREYWRFLIQEYPVGIAKNKILVALTAAQEGLTVFVEELPDLGVEIADLETQDQVAAWLDTAGRMICAAARLQIQSNLPRVLHHAMLMIQQHYDQALQLSSLARECGVNPNYLGRLFKEYLHTTFVDYLNSIRLHQAEQLMAKGTLRLKEVSWAVGYRDPNYFSRIFKKYRGQTPKEFIALSDQEVSHG